MAPDQLLLEECERQFQSIEERRCEILDRLYERKALVDNLIRTLEDYQRHPVRRAECIPISLARKCS